MADTMNLELLKRLCATPGIAGREERVRAVVVEELRPLVDELRFDALGSVIGTRRGDGPRVMLAASHGRDRLFRLPYRRQRVSSACSRSAASIARTLIAQRVLVHGYARISLSRARCSRASKPIHLLDQDEIKPAKLEEFFVDLGLPVERVRAEIELGDIVTLDRELDEAGDCVMSKALDDRVGVFVMLEALARHEAEQRPKSSPWPPPRKKSACAARDNGRLRQLQPDIAVALDITLALDIPGMPSELAITHLGDGRGDQGHGLVPHRQPGAAAAPARPGRGERHPLPARDPAARRHRRGLDATGARRRGSGHAVDPVALCPHRQRDGQPTRHRWGNQPVGTLSRRRGIAILWVRAVVSRAVRW